MAYSVTCPKTGERIYFDSIIRLREFAIGAMKKNPDCTRTIHIRNGSATVGTMRRTPNGVVFRSSATKKDRILNADGTLRQSRR